MLNEEETDYQMELNGMTKEEMERSWDIRDSIFNLINLGVTKSIKCVEGFYITTKDNAIYYKEMYGWQFSRL
ncbi:hypothetical protein [Clostridium estertheticum]|uniref:hypothetical protein n=1 Tax=Clostridium estertheticum TaxID=238834 RepID=UPI001C0B2159|nr:hypothetical protein [Clostridium estertheticum]MBU3186571.1 hypothetical protein [Clostridium estertheticum]